MAPKSETVTLAILGASGDLTERLLLPGLGTLLTAQPDRKVAVVGVGRSTVSDRSWRSTVRKALRKGGLSGDAADRVVEGSRWITADSGDEADLRRLFDELPQPFVVYFALPPKVLVKVAELMARIGVPASTRLGIEKPFGNDLTAARALNRTIAKLVPENQVFRVDHFLGKSTVLNLLGLRFANRLWEPVWNANHIERVDIVADETLALEGRAQYYDTAGALVDMLQSHLLLVMAMVAMEEPARLDALELRDLQLHVLRATQVVKGSAAHPSSRRARYTAGKVNGTDVPAYTREEGVNPANDTETLAEVTLNIHTTRWAGVPFVLRSGKALGTDRQAVIVHFRPMPHLPQGMGKGPANRLTLDLSTGEVQLELAVNGGGDKLKLEATTMTACVNDSPVKPYGEVLDGVMNGDPLLSVRGDVAEECWRIVSPVLYAWRAGKVPMDTYRAGTDGPASWR